MYSRGHWKCTSALATLLSLVAGGGYAASLPGHGHFVSGTGSINKASQSVTVKQSSTTGIIDWNRFSVGKGNSVSFDNGNGATLNRVTGGNLSTIAGSLHATGSLYLMNNAGVIVSNSGHVMTGGSFVVSSGNIGTAFDNEKLKAGSGKVINKGTIVSGGSATLVGSEVTDRGTIRATAVDLSATHKLAVDGVVSARDSDGSGGAVTARARTIVIGTDGNIDASASVAGRKGGTISVVARGTTTVAGALSANGGTRGAGGFIDTSGEHVQVADSARISTQAASGKTGTWQIDPTDFTIAASGGDITGTALSSELAANNVTIKSSQGATSGEGDIFVDAAVKWSSTHTLTLDAVKKIEIGAPITLTGAGGLVLVDEDSAQTGTTQDSTQADLFFEGGKIVFSGKSGTTTQGRLTIDGNAYTLANSVGQLAADIAANPSGNFALADNYNAASDGVYKSSPIATTFTGFFEGLGNTISNLTIDDTSNNAYVGLFAQIGNFFKQGTVKDISLTNAHVTATGKFVAVGALAGLNLANIEDSYATGAVKVGTGSNSADVGGLVGVNQGGSILRAHSTATVSAGNAPSNLLNLLGGLVGYNTDGGEIIESYASGAVTGGTSSTAGGLVGDDDSNLAFLSIIGSFATGAVKAQEAGGLIGFNTGFIENSFATGKVSGNGSGEIGGFVGYNSDGEINTSYATGTVSVDKATDDVNAGGFAGINTGNVSNSYATGAVLGGDAGAAGGFVGLNVTPDGVIDESYELGAVSGTGSTIGGFAGSNGGVLGGSTAVYYDSINVQGVGTGTAIAKGGALTPAQLNTASSFAGWTFGTSPVGFGWVIVDQDGSLNNASGAGGGTTPMLVAEYSTSIDSAHQLQLMALDPTAHYTLARSIDMTSTSGGDVWSGAGFIPVGGNGASGDFTGTFDGGGFTISHLVIDDLASDDDVGMFGGIASGGIVRNVNLTDADVTGASTAFVGGLAGISMGTITGSSVAGAVVGGQAVGGLSGYNGGTISADHTSGTVSGGAAASTGGLIGQNESTVSNSFSTSAVSGDGASGGLIGASDDGLITASYATGAVSGGTGPTVGGLIGDSEGDTIRDSYAMGRVSGNGGDIGGLVGDSTSTISTSYALGAVSGTNAQIGGLIGGDFGTVSHSYFDRLTSGAGATQGAGNVASDAGITALTTAQLQSALPSGFSSTAWHTGTGLLPYLAWQFSSTPRAISGFAYTDQGVTALKAGTVSVVVGGSSLGSVSTGANGYYYVLDAAGTNSNVFAYVAGTGGAAFADNAAGSVSNLDIDKNYLTETTAGASSTALATDLAAAIGTNSGAHTAIADLDNVTVNATGASFVVDGTLDVSGTLFFNASGSVTENSAGELAAKAIGGSAKGPVTLTSALNTIADLDSFAAGGTFSLTDDANLIIAGALNSGTANANLTTVGTAHSIAVDAQVSAGALDLAATGNITEGKTGIIAAKTLLGSSGGTVGLNGQNLITDLGAFSTSGNNRFELTDDHGLTLVGAINVGTGLLELTTVGSAHNLAVDSVITAGTVNLVTTGEATESSAGAIKASTLLNVTANTGISLTSSANQIKKLGAHKTNSGPNTVTL